MLLHYPLVEGSELRKKNFTFYRRHIYTLLDTMQARQKATHFFWLRTLCCFPGHFHSLEQLLVESHLEELQSGWMQHISRDSAMAMWIIYKG